MSVVFGQGMKAKPEVKVNGTLLSPVELKDDRKVDMKFTSRRN